MPKSAPFLIVLLIIAIVSSILYVLFPTTAEKLTARHLNDNIVVHFDVSPSGHIRYATSSKSTYRDGRVVSQESTASLSNPSKVQFNNSNVVNSIYKMDGWFSTKFYLVPSKVSKVEKYINDGKSESIRLFYPEYLDSDTNHYGKYTTNLIRSFLREIELEHYQ